MKSAGRLAAKIPWWSKILIKLLLARLQISYRTWCRLGVFLHGSMGDPAYAWRVFSLHLAEFQKFCDKDIPGEVLELGPGDSPFSGAFGAALGIRWTYLVDSGPFFSWNAASSKKLRQYMEEAHPDLIIPEGPGLKDIRTEYLTQGLDSLRSIPSASVDFLWSQAVLEHLPRCAFYAFLTEMRRIVRPEGLLSHRVDLRDHLGGRLNNLRFSETIWETSLFRNSGFYTNRLRQEEILAAFRQAGFEVVSLVNERWPQMPTPRKRMIECFRSFPEDELLISGFNLVLRPVRGSK